MGAICAHGYKPKNPKFKEHFQKGVDYHLMHSALIAIAPIARRPDVVSQLQSLMQF